MRKRSRTQALTVGVIALVVPVALASGSSAVNIGDEGCTPGYWKNHTDDWFEDAERPIPTTRRLGTIGLVPAGHHLGSDSLLDALNYRGGPRVEGAERILLRAAAAAYLNAASEELGYPYRRNADPFMIIATARDAVASGDRAYMLDIASTLDAANNLGCPL